METRHAPTPLSMHDHTTQTPRVRRGIDARPGRPERDHHRESESHARGGLRLTRPGDHDADTNPAAPRGSGGGGGVGGRSSQIEPSDVAAPVSRIIATLAAEIGAARFERYFEGQASLSLVGSAQSGVSTLEVRVPSASLAGVLTRRFAEALHAAARQHVQGEVAVEIRVDAVGDVGGVGATLPRLVTDTIAEPAPRAASPAHTAANTSASPSTRLSRVARYRLDDFIVGDANRLAYNAVAQLAEGMDHAGGRTGFGTLVLHGLCGVGKTHLLQGAALRFKERNPGAVVRLTSGEQFMQEFVQAIRNQTVDRFRKTYRRVDLLCIDDVHFLADKKATQDELLHTFDEIAREGARVILACDEHPRDVTRLSDALTSRFVSGMVVRVDLPDTAMREQMARSFAARRGLILDDAAASAIAERCSHAASARDLEGLVLRIEATARLLPGFISEDGRVGVLAVERTLADERPAARGIGSLAGAHASSLKRDAHGAPSGTGAGGGGGKVLKPVRIDAIIEYVCLILRVERADLMGRGRHKRVVLARAVISHVARSLTTHSYPEIAKALGRPNHSTIITACQRLAKQISGDEILEAEAMPSSTIGGISMSGAVSVRELVRRVTEELARRRN